MQKIKLKSSKISKIKISLFRLMSVKLLLITGWGGGTKLLVPLKHGLEEYGYEVELINIFNALDINILQQHVEHAKQFNVIVGWSLGGQLATLLVDQIKKQYHQYKILITLGSNPCFVQTEDWQYAMSKDEFKQFKTSFDKDAVSTLKKFGFMVCQGMLTAKDDFRTLQSLIQAQNLDTLKAGLDVLGTFNNVNILQDYDGYQYHLFAKQDYLVSYKVQQKIAKLAVKFLETELISGSHGFPLFYSQDVSCKIYQYLEKIKKSCE